MCVCVCVQHNLNLQGLVWHILGLFNHLIYICLDTYTPAGELQGNSQGLVWHVVGLFWRVTFYWSLLSSHMSRFDTFTPSGELQGNPRGSVTCCWSLLTYCLSLLTCYTSLLTHSHELEGSVWSLVWHVLGLFWQPIRLFWHIHTSRRAIREALCDILWSLLTRSRSLLTMYDSFDTF